MLDKMIWDKMFKNDGMNVKCQNSNSKSSSKSKCQKEKQANKGTTKFEDKIQN